MDKLWTGRLQKGLDEAANDFNSSIRFDSRMIFEDIQGSMAHAAMLAKKGIISPQDQAQILEGLGAIADELKSGKLAIDLSSEDVHTFVENELTRRVGDAGKRLHTARSRNDQVALDLRIYLKNQITLIRQRLTTLISALLTQAEGSMDAIMPGYTHMQRAQPITFAHHLMAYVMMLLRDLDRLDDCFTRTNVLPLGCCALAGTTYDIDREMVAEQLGFSDIARNSMDGVSDRDFAVELAADIALIMMHLSRLSEEIILWSSWEFKFIDLDDTFSTGSSIMPQKKNPDIAELVRGKTGRAYGDLVALLTQLKGLPLAYNKDMQEDKEAVFDSVDTVLQCLEVFAPMILTLRINRERMREAAAGGFINATDCADYLTRKGLPFRTAYKITGELVAHCIGSGKTLETLSLDEYRAFHPLFEKDIFTEISLDTCVLKRISPGSPSPQSVKEQILWAKSALERRG